MISAFQMIRREISRWGWDDGNKLAPVAWDEPLEMGWVAFGEGPCCLTRGLGRPLGLPESAVPPLWSGLTHRRTPWGAVRVQCDKTCKAPGAGAWPSEASAALRLRQACGISLWPSWRWGSLPAARGPPFPELSQQRQVGLRGDLALLPGWEGGNCSQECRCHVPPCGCLRPLPGVGDESEPGWEDKAALGARSCHSRSSLSLFQEDLMGAGLDQCQPPPSVSPRGHAAKPPRTPILPLCWLEVGTDVMSCSFPLLAHLGQGLAHMGCNKCALMECINIYTGLLRNRVYLGGQSMGSGDQQTGVWGR